MPSSIVTPSVHSSNLLSAIANKFDKVQRGIATKLKGTTNVHENVKSAASKTGSRREGRVVGGQKASGSGKSRNTSALNHDLNCDEAELSVAEEALSPRENRRQETAIDPDDCRKKFEQDSLESLFGAAGKQRDKLRRFFDTTPNEIVKIRLTHIAATYHMALQGEAPQEATAELNKIMTGLTDKMLSDKLGRKSIFGSHQPSRNREYQEVKAIEKRLVNVMESIIGKGPTVVANYLFKQMIEPFIIGYLEQKSNSRLTNKSRDEVMKFIDANAWSLLDKVRKGIETYHTGAIDKTYRAIDAILVAPHLLKDIESHLDKSELDPGAPFVSDTTEIALPADTSIIEPTPDRAGDSVPSNENGRPTNGSGPDGERANTGNTYNTYNNFVYSPTNNTYAPVNMTFSPTTVNVNNYGIPAFPGRPEGPVFAVPPRTAVPDPMSPIVEQPDPRPSAATAVGMPADASPVGEALSRRLNDIRVIATKSAPVSPPRDANNVISATPGLTRGLIVNSQPQENGASQYAGPRITPQAPRTAAPPSGPATSLSGTGMSASSAAVETAKTTLTNQGRQLSQLPRKAPQVRHFNRPITGSGTVQPSRITPASVVRQPAAAAPASITPVPASITPVPASITPVPASITPVSAPATAASPSLNIAPVAANPEADTAVSTPDPAIARRTGDAPTTATAVEMAKTTLTNQGRQLSQLPRKAPQVRHFNRPITGSGTVQPSRITSASVVRQPAAAAPASITPVPASITPVPASITPVPTSITSVPAPATAASPSLNIAPVAANPEADTAVSTPDPAIARRTGDAPTTATAVETAKTTLTNQGRQLSQLPRKAPQVRHFNRPITGSGTVQPSRITPASVVRQPAAAAPASITPVPASITPVPASITPVPALITPVPAPATAASPSLNIAPVAANPEADTAVSTPDPAIARRTGDAPTTAAAVETAKITLTNQGRQLSQLPRKAPQVRHFNRPTAGSGTTRSADALTDARGRLKAGGSGPIPKWLSANGEDSRSRAVKPAANTTMPTAMQQSTKESIDSAPKARQPITERLDTIVPAQAKIIQSQPLKAATPQYSTPLTESKTPRPASAQPAVHRREQPLTDLSPASAKPVSRREPKISDLDAGKPKVVLSNEGLRRPGRSKTDGTIFHRAPLNQPAESLADAHGRLKRNGPGPMPKWLKDIESEQPISSGDK